MAMAWCLLVLLALAPLSSGAPSMTATIGRLADPPKLGSFAPAPAPQTALENATVRDFETKVLQAVNQSSLASYVAVVYFHLPSCRPCRDTLPELRDARARVEESVRVRDIVLIRPVRMFVLDCSLSEAAPVCARFTRNSYPAILGFRQGRVLYYNRPREGEVIAWWISRLARPSFFLLETFEQWKNAHLQRLPSYLLLLADAYDQDAVDVWEDLALDSLERLNFYVALPTKGDWSSLTGKPPSVHFSAHVDLGLDPLPFHGVHHNAREEALRNWIEVCAVKAVTPLDSWTARELLRAGLPIVTLRHGQDAAGLAAVETFRRRTREMRQSQRYLFATLDIDDWDVRLLARSWFPLMGKNFEDYIPYSWTPPPAVFVYTKTATGSVGFWYESEFADPATFKLMDVDSMISHGGFFFDNSWVSKILQYLMRFDRYGNRSPLHRLIWFLTPFVFFWGLAWMLRGKATLLGSDSDSGHSEAPKAVDVDPVDAKSKRARKTHKKTR